MNFLNLTNIIKIPDYLMLIEKYLSKNDFINLIKIRKDFYYDSNLLSYFKQIIKQKSGLIIYKIIKQYTHYVNYVNNTYLEIDIIMTNAVENNIGNLVYINTSLLNSMITKKMNAIYYFKNYEKKYIKLYFNSFQGWKKDILNKYLLGRVIENPTRLDLFLLIKKMDKRDVYNIGM
jgi:hypothetical protein